MLNCLTDYHLALPIQYEIVTLNICKIFKLRISFWILQWFYAHLLCKFHVPTNNRKLFWKRNPSFTKNLHHNLQVNVSPLLYENLAESSLKNALSHNLQEKLDAHNRLHPSSICLESTLDLVILCHQAALKSWGRETALDEWIYNVTFKGHYNTPQYLPRCKVNGANAFWDICFKENSHAIPPPPWFYTKKE